MERSPSLSEDVGLATDGEIDIKETSSGNQALSTSSSGHFVYAVTSSLQTDSLHRTTAPPVRSYFHEGNGNVKSSFFNTGSDRPAETFQDYRQSEIRWLLDQIGGSRLLTVADVSSFIYRVAVDHTYTSTTETVLVPSVRHEQLIPPSSTIHNQQTLASSSGTLKLVSTEHKIADSNGYNTANVYTHSPARTGDLEPSHVLLVNPVYDRSQVLNDKPTAFHLNTISAIVDKGAEPGLQTANTELFITPSQVGAESEDCIRNPLKPALSCSLPAVVSTDILSTAHGGSSSLHLDTLTVEFWHADREHSTSGQTYVTRTDHVLNGAAGSGVTETSSPITSGITHHLATVDTAGSHADVLTESDAVVSFAASSDFGNLTLNVTSPSILQENDTRLDSSQLTNIRNITETSPSVISKHRVTAASESVPTRTIITLVFPPQIPSLYFEDTVLFPVSTSTFSDARILDYSRIYSGQLLTTTSGEDSQEINTFATEAEAGGTSRLTHSGDLSIVKSLQEITETANTLPGHSIVDNKLTDHTYTILAKDMEISTASSMYLQTSSTLSYDSTFFGATLQGSDNVNQLPTVFNDPLAETTPHKPLFLQSTTVNQALTTDIASHPTISQPVDPAPTVSISATMFITMETSGLSNVTDVVQATGRITTTQKMNFADGETSSRQMPSFNTTIIIASACVVLALVIFVIITICCLRRKRRSKSSASRQEGDDLWVDLYRSNSSHQMPLPSLTTCPSNFEMTDTLKSGSSGDITDNENKDKHTSEADSSVMKQMKSRRQISSFQIKTPKLEAEQLEPTHAGSELAFSEDHAENWQKMATSASMTSLPTTEVSYHTNVTDYNLAAVGQRFRAVYNYKPVCKGEMALKEGELVECKERDRNGWMLGYKPKTHEEGWFPAVYVDEISCDNDLDFTCEIPETYDLLESNKLNSTDQYWTGIEHQVCYRYQSSVPGDLDIEPGQTVIVLQTLANGWWFAINGNKCGWFPGTYVEIITDSGMEDHQANGDLCQLNDHTRVSTDAQEATAAQTAEDKSDTGNSSLASISELPAVKENIDEDQTQSARTDVADETSKLNVSTPTAIQVGNRHEVAESTCAADSSEIKPTVLFTINEQTPVQGDTHSAEDASTNAGTNVSADKLNHSQKRLEHSLRPARPAPPPPKYNNSKVKKDGKISTKNNSEIQACKTQDPVFKKPVILIHGKRPKMQKVLRSQLDEKQLNPMIRPSTRGFIPKPTAYTYDGVRNEHRSTAGEHVHSNQSITNDLQGEQVMFSQSHNPTDHISPFQSRSQKPLSQHEFKSSKTSLESCPETRRVYPAESTPQNEHDKVNNSNTSTYFPLERSQTPDYRRERSLTPDYKRDRSNSPILLTTGNLLHNVQRFHGAVKYPIPLGNEKGSLKSSSAEKREMEIANTSSNTLSTFGGQQRSAPITAPNRKIPPIESLHNKQTFGALHDHNSENSVNVPYSYESLGEHPNSENMLPTNMLPIHTDSIQEDMSNRQQHPPKCSNSDNTTLTQESFIITPGTVSEIVQQINKQSPLHTELQQKVKSDKRQPEPADCPTRHNILGENHAQKSMPADQSQNTASSSSSRDTTFDDVPSTTL